MWLGNRLIVVSFQWMFFSETGLQLRLFPLVSFLILPIDKACPYKPAQRAQDDESSHQRSYIDTRIISLL